MHVRAHQHKTHVRETAAEASAAVDQKEHGSSPYVAGTRRTGSNNSSNSHSSNSSSSSSSNSSSLDVAGTSNAAPAAAAAKFAGPADSGVLDNQQAVLLSLRSLILRSSGS